MRPPHGAFCSHDSVLRRKGEKLSPWAQPPPTPQHPIPPLLQVCLASSPHQHTQGPTSILQAPFTSTILQPKVLFLSKAAAFCHGAIGKELGKDKLWELQPPLLPWQEPSVTAEVPG